MRVADLFVMDRYMAAISGNGDSYGSAEALSQSGAAQCDIRGIEYAAQMTNTGYVVNLQLPWHHFVNMDQFADELAAFLNPGYGGRASPRKGQAGAGD